MSNMPYRPMPRQPEPLNANNRMALYFREESRLREKEFISVDIALFNIFNGIFACNAKINVHSWLKVIH